MNVLINKIVYKGLINEKKFEESKYGAKNETGIRKIVKDFTLQFDGYDANERPLFISFDNPDMEYTIDSKGAVWSHDGYTNEIVGKI